MGRKGWVLGFKGGRNAAFWATDPHEDSRIAPHPTRVQLQFDPTDSLVCFTRALDSNPEFDPFD